ncbi:MAG TPA: hypothetical protein VG477_06625, partial [Thermoanaerobaculia bacterium]|nr:hypothetical protein [Thermoanaerobaculia bacterium]
MSPRAVRSVLAVLILACAGLVFAQAGGLLGGPAEPPALSRIFPLRAEKAAGGGDPWLLFDGNTERGFAGSAEGPSRVRLLLDGEQALTAVGVFGPADGRVAVWAEEDGVPVLLLEMEPRGTGWQRIPVPRPVTTRSLLVDWQPASPGAVLPEIELWSARRAEGGERSANGLPAAVQVAGGAPAVMVRLSGDPGTAERAFLSYELTGLSHWSQAVRSING